MAEHVYLTVDQLPTAGPKDGTEVMEVVQGGVSRKISAAELIKLDAYDVSVGQGPIISTDNQCYVIQNTAVASPIEIVLPTDLLPNRARVITVIVYGKSNELVWPPEVFWSDGRAQKLADNVTIYGILWDGIRLHGGCGMAY